MQHCRTILETYLTTSENAHMYVQLRICKKRLVSETSKVITIPIKHQRNTQCQDFSSDGVAFPVFHNICTLHELIMTTQQ